MFEDHWLLERAIFLIPLILSLSVHEWAHAWTASLLGDETARSQGRVTLDPLSHIDPVGTLLVPLLGVPVGWAKPVPFNPARFRAGVSMGMGTLMTAAAGPVSNLVLALICAFLAAGASIVYPDSQVSSFLTGLAALNVALALFNSLPVPPLDGSRIVDALMPDRFRHFWDNLCAIGPVALLIVIAVPCLFGVSLFAGAYEAVYTMVEGFRVILGAGVSG